MTRTRKRIWKSTAFLWTCSKHQKTIKRFKFPKHHFCNLFYPESWKFRILMFYSPRCNDACPKTNLKTYSFYGNVQNIQKRSNASESKNSTFVVICCIQNLEIHNPHVLPGPLQWLVPENESETVEPFRETIRKLLKHDKLQIPKTYHFSDL